MSIPYSKRFLGQAGLLGTGPSFVVAPGFVVVVKQVTFFCSSGLFDVTAFLEDEPTGAALIQESWSTTDSHSAAFYGAIVFLEGDGFHVQVDTAGTAGVDYSVSGYLLTS